VKQILIKGEIKGKYNFAYVNKYLFIYLKGLKILCRTTKHVECEIFPFPVPVAGKMWLRLKKKNKKGVRPASSANKDEI